MKILAIDSSGMVASAALVCDGNLVAEYTINNKKTHSQTLLPMIDEMMRAAETELSAIDAIAIASGPGSFTGLRIGAATAKGLALALDIPVIPVSTLEGLAYNVWGDDKLICPIMDARRNQVYTALYRFDDHQMIHAELEQMPMDADDLLDILAKKEERVLFVGDGIDRFGEHIRTRLSDMAIFAPAHLRKQRAGSIAAAGADRAVLPDGQMSGDDFAPDYLRASQAERERKEKGEKYE